MKKNHLFFIILAVVSFLFVFTTCNPLSSVTEFANTFSSDNDKSLLEHIEIESTVSTTSGHENSENAQAKPQNELIPPNAYDINTLGAVVTYNSPDTPEQIVEWYETGMLEKGWLFETKMDTILIKIFSLSNNTESKVVSVSAGDSGGAMVVISEE